MLLLLVLLVLDTMGHNPFCTNETTFCTLWYDTIHPIILVSLTQPFRLLKLDEIHTVDSQSKWMIELHKISLGFFVAFDKNLQKNIWEGISSVCSISKDIFRFTAVAMSFIYMNKIEFFTFYMIKFNPFSVEHWNLLCISTEFCFHHFSLFHLFYSLPNFVIWKYVIRCTMSSISSMETKIEKLCKHKIVIPFSWNASLLHTICGFYLPSPLLFILPHLFYPYHFFSEQRMQLFSLFHFTFSTQYLHGNESTEIEIENSFQRIYGKGNQIQ